MEQLIVLAIVYFVFKKIKTIFLNSEQARYKYNSSKKYKKYSSTSKGGFAEFSQRVNNMAQNSSKRSADAEKNCRYYERVAEDTSPEFVDDSYEKKREEQFVETAPSEYVKDIHAKEYFDEHELHYHDEQEKSGSRFAKNNKRSAASDLGFSKKDVINGIIWHEILQRPRRLRKG